MLVMVLEEVLLRLLRSSTPSHFVPDLQRGRVRMSRPHFFPTTRLEKNKRKRLKPQNIGGELTKLFSYNT